MLEHNFCVDWEILRNQHNVWGAVTEGYGQDADLQNLKLYSGPAWGPGADWPHVVQVSTNSEAAEIPLCLRFLSFISFL